MAVYVWDEEKNRKLKRERDIGFEIVISAIQEGNVVDDYPHPNAKRYPRQRMMAVIVDNYVYLVPYLGENATCILKTIIPSRKATKKYIKITKGG